MKKKIKNFFKGIFIRFVLSFIVVGLLPISGMIYIIYHKLPIEVESYMIANYEEILLYTGKSLKIRLDEFDALLKSIYSLESLDAGIQPNLEDQISSGNIRDNQEKLMDQYINSVLYTDQYIESVFFLNAQNKVLGYQSKSTNFYYEDIQFENITKFSEIRTDKRSLTILPSHHEEYFSKKNKRVLTFARNHLDINYLPSIEKVNNILLIDVNDQFITDILNRLELIEQSEIIILDRDEYLIYTSKNEVYEKEKDVIDDVIFSEAITYESGHYISGEDLYFYNHIEEYDWYMFYKVNRLSMSGIIQELRTVATVLLVLIVITFILFALIFSQKLSKPIKNISTQMKKVAYGDLTTKVEVQDSYEAMQLAEAFNKMTEKLKEYIEKAYMAQIKQKEAELDAIKTQIRPHYLYNTLEIIRMSALDEDAENTEEMIVALSNQLRYVIGHSKQRVTLKMEIEMIYHYFKIIKIRFENRVSLEMNIPKEFYEYKILKLLIQPVVENAVIHGLKVKKGKGKVKLSARVVDNTLEVQIIDDGIGMDETKVDIIRKMLDSNNLNNDISSDQESIGLKNVHDRIQMTYGKQFGLFVKSKKNYGTLVTLTIPVEKGGE